jgi:hypothetical protein
VKVISLHPDADGEITEAARYYESREPGLGSDLLGEVERAFDQILTNPDQRVARKLGGECGGSPCGGSLTICYTQFILKEYESWRSLIRNGGLSTGEND